MVVQSASIANGRGNSTLFKRLSTKQSHLNNIEHMSIMLVQSASIAICRGNRNGCAICQGHNKGFRV